MDGDGGKRTERLYPMKEKKKLSLFGRLRKSTKKKKKRIHHGSKDFFLYVIFRFFNINNQ